MYSASIYGYSIPERFGFEALELPQPGLLYNLQSLFGTSSLVDAPLNYGQALEDKGVSSELDSNEFSQSITIPEADLDAILPLEAGVRQAGSRKKHVCSKCGNSFPRAHRLNEHILSKHWDVKLFKCSRECGKLDCERTYTSDRNLKRHQSPKRKICDKCHKSISEQNISKHKKACRASNALDI